MANTTTGVDMLRFVASYDMLQAVAFHFDKAKPFIPMYIHLIISALLPIYAGAHASLSRPSSAAKPDKQAKKKRDDDAGDDDDGEQKMEGLSPVDAIVMPIMAAFVLGGLYWLIKRFGSRIVNIVLACYFSVIGVGAVGKLNNDGLEQFVDLVFPNWYTSAKNLWKVNSFNNTFDGQARIDSPDPPTRHSPLPGIFGWFDIGSSANKRCWALRKAAKQEFQLVAKGSQLINVDIDFTFTLVNVFSLLVGLVVMVGSHLVGQTWWITNLQGFAVCYGALQILSPTTFLTGSMILVGLFLYDIWAVFFTPFMIGVAKSLDQPIKLVFPRPEDPSKPGENAYSMLGLGDIVLPGIMIGLALRFDLYMFYLKKQTRIVDGQVNAQTKKLEDRMEKVEFISPHHRLGDWFWTRSSTFHKTTWGPLHAQLAAAAFPKPYFLASIFGYVGGMLATLGAMSVYDHAQPALLYLVPAVLATLWTTAIIKGELPEMWNYSEAVSGEASDEEEIAKDENNLDTKSQEKPKTWMETITAWLYGETEKKAKADITDDDSKSSDKKSNGSNEGDSDTNSSTAEKAKKKPATNPIVFHLTISRIEKGRPSLFPSTDSEDSFTKFVASRRGDQEYQEHRKLFEEAFFGTQPCSNVKRFEYGVWSVFRGLHLVG